MSSVSQSLQSIEAFARSKGKTLGLRPGAPPAAIDALEAALGRPLPAGYRELLRFADGQADDPGFPWMPGCDRLAPVGTIAAQLADERGMTEDFPPPEHEDLGGWIRGGRYHPNRIPIAGSRFWDQDNTYLDLDPGSSGKSGQLITLVSECDFVVLGESLEHALERYASALASGEMVWHDAEGALAPRGERPHSGHPAYAFALVK
jgi:cell wall assembly regulator SMI1